MAEKQILEDFYNLQTCSPRRIKKIQGIIVGSKRIIGKDLTKLKQPDITKFLREVNNNYFTQWTKNDYKKIFKAFLKWHYKKEFLDWMEIPQIKDGFKTASKRRAMNRVKINKETLIKPEELEKMLKATKGQKWVAILTLLYESALRPCELVMLQWEDLKFQDSKNMCSVIVKSSPKTKEPRTIPVKDCVVHLKMWREMFEFPDRTEKDFVFPNPQDRTKHLSEAGLGVIMSRISKKAGLRNIYPYLFRHSRIYFIQKRLGSRIASKYAGHSLETSQIYDHLDSDDVEEALLEKVYITEEISPEEENELKKELQRQKLAFELFKQEMEGFMKKKN